MPLAGQQLACGVLARSHEDDTMTQTTRENIRRALRIGAAGAPLFAVGCGSSVPAEWQNIAPSDGLDRVVDAASDSRHLTAYYEAGISAAHLRTRLSRNARAEGFAPVYHCEYPDGRLADRYLDSPRSLEWMLIPENDGRLMLVVTRHDDTAAFAPPDAPRCTTARREGRG